MGIKDVTRKNSRMTLPYLLISGNSKIRFRNIFKTLDFGVNNYKFPKKCIFLNVKILTLLCLILSSIHIAGASVTYNLNVIAITDTNKVCNMSTLYSTLADRYGENYTKENILNETSPEVWWCNGSIKVANPGNFWINETDTKELKICSDYRGWAFEGYITPRNVKLISWNRTTDNPNDFTSGAISVMYNEAHNVDFSNFKVVYFGYIYGKNIQDLSYSNITLNNTKNGLSFQMAENITADNITIQNGDPTFGDGLDYCYMNNSTLSNICVINVSDCKNPSTGAYGLTLLGNNNIVHDCYINGVSWSGTNLQGSNLTVYNFTVINSGHNGFESQTYDSRFRNITVTDSYAHNFFQVSRKNILARNNTYEDLYSARPGTGYGIFTGDNSCDTIIKNSTFLGKGVCIIDSTNITVINCIQGWSEKGAGLYFSRVAFDNKNHTVIDSSFLYNTVTNSSIDSNVVFDTTISGVNDTKLVNVIYERSFFYILNNISRYYYADIIVVDDFGKPIDGTKIDFTNEIDPSVKSTDGWGIYKTSFSTVKGQTSLPNNARSNSPAIAKFNMPNKSTTNFYTHTTSITTSDNRTVSLSGITPDSSWYRKDPNIPTYTITAIIPNTSSTGPQIIGFAPAEDNPFNPGETKNFRVWTNESLNEMLWYVDGSDSPVSKGSLNYTWTVTDRNTTIEFIGSNANGTVNKTWYLGGSSDEPSVPDNPVQEIKFSPADSILTRNVFETVSFSVSPDVFTTKEWYIDGKLVQNNTVSMSKIWSSAGTYNVTFSGSGSENVLHTWTVSVVEKPKEQNETIITIAPEYQVVEPKKPFNLSVKIEPATPITGAQLDFVFDGSTASVNNVTEGDLLKQSGAYTIFSSGTINNTAGTVKNIYGFILGTSNVSTPGTMATVNLTAGSKTGMAKFSLSNVLISDANSKSTPYTVTNATVLIDTAPVISSICCPKSVYEKSTLTFKVSAKDADCDRLVLSASGVPQGAVFNTTSGNFTWTPAVGQAGVYTITFKVSDGYLTDSESVTVTVNKLNNPPVISSFEPLNGSSFSEGERIGISVNASDAEGQALNYSIRIDGVACSTDTEYVWETDYSSSGNHTIEVVVSDGIDEAKAQRTVFINECHPRWDVNEDGVVNILDITMVSQTYGTTVNKPYPRHDVNQDGVVNILDLTLVGNHFGEYVN